MNKTVFRSGLVVWLSLAGAAASGCGRATEYCDAMCECELCNDRDYDQCIIDKEADIDLADAYECAEDYDAYLQCRLDEADCDDLHWGVDGDDCDDDAQDFNECVEDATDLGGGSSSSSSGGDVCVCSCTCESGATATVCNGSGCCTSECETQCQAEGLGASSSVSETCGSGGG